MSRAKQTARRHYRKQDGYLDQDSCMEGVNLRDQALSRGDGRKLEGEYVLKLTGSNGDNEELEAKGQNYPSFVFVTVRIMRKKY